MLVRASLDFIAFILDIYLALHCLLRFRLLVMKYLNGGYNDAFAVRALSQG